jgi:hypothetical protein
MGISVLGFRKGARCARSARGLAGPAAAAAAVALALAALGCDRDQVSRATVDTRPAAAGQAPAAPAMPTPPEPQGAMPQGAMPPGAMPQGAMPPEALPPPPRPTGKGALRWALPKGWTETPGGGMRFATLNPPSALGAAGAAPLEVSVVVLPGAAGGETANVNRWRGQIGLPALDEAAAAAARKGVRSRAGEVAVYDFTSEGQVRTRMVVGLLASAQDQTWFLKLTGPEAAVARVRPAFMKCLESLRLD